MKWRPVIAPALLAWSVRSKLVDDVQVNRQLHEVVSTERTVLMLHDFNDAIADLADSLGVAAEDAATDEHSRWDLYRTAIAVQTSPTLILAAIRREPNPPLASAVVVWALEHRGADERDRWLDVLSPGRDLDYARRRARELGIFERLRDGPEFGVTAADVAGWTQWLQRRVAEESDRYDVLDVLKVAGASKGIRRLAHDRIGRL